MSDFFGEPKSKETSEETKATVVAALRERIAEAELEELEGFADLVVTHDLSAVAANAVTLAITQPQPAVDQPGPQATTDTDTSTGRDCFYPERDEEIRALLSELSAAELPTMTVPNTVEMQKGNTAIAVNSAAQVRQVAQQLYIKAKGLDGVNRKKLRARVCVGMMLLKESLTGLDRDGNVIHEAGHIVLGQKAETGEVFAYEIRTITDRYGLDAAVAWVMKRPISYYAQKVNGRVEALDEAMRTLGEEVTRLWEKERGQVERNRAEAKSVNKQSAETQEKRPPRFTVIGVGETITGTLEELRRKVGPDAKTDTISETAMLGSIIRFGQIQWKLKDFSPGQDGTVFELERVKET